MSLIIDPKSDFVRRHVGPGEGDIREMLEFLGYAEMEGLVQDTVPDGIRLRRELDIPSATPEHLLLDELREIAKENRVFRSYIGMGYHDTVTPGVIARNILENPGWYTQYTPYQAELSQGTLQAIFEWQTMVCGLTGLEVSNASMYDGASAVAEAALMAMRITRRSKVLVSAALHPHWRQVLETYLGGLGAELATLPRAVDGRSEPATVDAETACVILQQPNFLGVVESFGV